MELYKLMTEQNFNAFKMFTLQTTTVKIILEIVLKVERGNDHIHILHISS